MYMVQTEWISESYWLSMMDILWIDSVMDDVVTHHQSNNYWICAALLIVHVQLNCMALYFGFVIVY